MRLNGYNHAGFKGSRCMLIRIGNRAGCGKPWRFMGNQPYAMCYKSHVILVRTGFQGMKGGFVNFTSKCARLDCGSSGRLNIENLV